jgi:RNA:NAD 2'-phosphotransferase (TPT1/KptA family)
MFRSNQVISYSRLQLLALSPAPYTSMASSLKGKGRGRGGRGRMNMDPEVQLSKTLSLILRHRAAEEGLAIRSDGYVKLDDLVSHSFRVYPRSF